MKIQIKEGYSPVKVKARRYSAEQRDFLNGYVNILVDMLVISEPKKSPAKYRMTNDLRPINAATVKQAWPMPHLVLKFMTSPAVRALLCSTLCLDTGNCPSTKTRRIPVES